MAKRLTILILGLLLLSAPLNAVVAVRAGVRGGSFAVGLQNRSPLSSVDWNWGYGGAVTAGDLAALGYASLQRTVATLQNQYPLYLGIGPEIGIQTDGNIGLGGFVHVGITNPMYPLFFEAGVDVLTGSGGITAEAGFMF